MRKIDAIIEGQITDGGWEALARNLLRAQLMHYGISYARLVELLARMGVEETEAAIKNKVSRGRFTFVFFLQAMVAIDANWLQIPNAEKLLQGDVLKPGGAQILAKKPDM